MDSLPFPSFLMELFLLFPLPFPVLILGCEQFFPFVPVSIFFLLSPFFGGNPFKHVWAVSTSAFPLPVLIRCCWQEIRQFIVKIIFAYRKYLRSVSREIKAVTTGQQYLSNPIPVVSYSTSFFYFFVSLLLRFDPVTSLHWHPPFPLSPPSPLGGGAMS